MSAAESARYKSISARIVNVARKASQDPNRVRRQLAFHRLMARLADTGWVLKGGYCLEIRLENQARATKDMDLVRRESVRNADALLDELDEILARSEFDDGFQFEAVSARAMRGPDDIHVAWRVPIRVTVDGHVFITLTLDLVSQFLEVADAVERLVVESPIPALGHEPVVINAVDVYQHAAEKYHAMSRIYAGDRTSSRVKDLVDLALLLDAGLLVDPVALRLRLMAVYRLRDQGEPPEVLPSPPGDWAERYAHLARDLGTSLITCDAAFHRVHEFYRAALVAQD